MRLTPLSAVFYGKLPGINILPGFGGINSSQVIDSRYLIGFDLQFFSMRDLTAPKPRNPHLGVICFPVPCRKRNHAILTP